MKNKLTDARRKINTVDGKMAKLFVKRMKAVEDVAEYKLKNELEIFDAKREAEVIERNSLLVDEKYRRSYVALLTELMTLSKEHQTSIFRSATEDVKADLTVELGEDSYPIYIGKGLIKNADKYLNLKRKVFIVTDSGVPAEYAEAVRKSSASATVITVEAGEGSKSMKTLESLLLAMSECCLDRSDCVVAVGGGVVGDLAGFAASVYMRGIDFYNIPTTLLSQVDSSIGGKTAINLDGVKNSVGAFKHPGAVLIDIDTLKTLPVRQMRNGLCEAIKMAATSNKELFELFERSSEAEVYGNLRTVITECLKIKKAVVEDDEKEKGPRRTLNFGHTVGHAIESYENLTSLLHGECVAIGMMAMSNGEARARIKAVLEKFSLPTSYKGEITEILPFAQHDKKSEGDKISAVRCDEIGKCYIKSISMEELKEYASNCINC